MPLQNGKNCLLWLQERGKKGATQIIRPATFCDAKPNMEMYQAESFVPTVSLIQLDGKDEAVKIANKIFSCNLRRALRLARIINSGAVHTNSLNTHSECIMEE